MASASDDEALFAAAVPRIGEIRAKLADVDDADTPGGSGTTMTARSPPVGRHPRVT